MTHDINISDYSDFVIRLLSFAKMLQHHFADMPKAVFYSEDGKLVLSEEFCTWLVVKKLAVKEGNVLKIDYKMLNLYSIYGHVN